jgi:hypothetical protein
MPPLPGLDQLTDAQRDVWVAFMANMHGSMQNCVSSTISAILPHVTPAVLHAQRTQNAMGRGTTTQRKKAKKDTKMLALLQEQSNDPPMIRNQFLVSATVRYCLFTQAASRSIHANYSNFIYVSIRTRMHGISSLPLHKMCRHSRQVQGQVLFSQR